jgi:hypothetical protein
MFYSLAKQDQFVANLLNFKKYGFYVDIGSHHSMVANNTYYFSEKLFWKGICVEIDSTFSNSYLNRTECNLIIDDATKINYYNLFTSNDVPKTIDYLSLDVDSASLDVLEILPLEQYRFKIITIEHDAYLHKDRYQSKQQNILIKNNYKIIAKNVFVEQNGHTEPECAFEDWYIDLNYFKFDKISFLYSENTYPSKIIDKFIL